MSKLLEKIEAKDREEFEKIIDSNNDNEIFSFLKSKNSLIENLMKEVQFHL